jgi:hypothetical protein
MTPWLHTATPPYILDEAITYCTSLKDLTLLGCDVSDAFFAHLNSSLRLHSLSISDFEHISPNALFEGLRSPVFSSLKRLAIWQRNGGINAAGQRITSGWFNCLFKSHWREMRDLAKRDVSLGTGWESLLLAGGQAGQSP